MKYRANRNALHQVKSILESLIHEAADETTHGDIVIYEQTHDAFERTAKEGDSYAYWRDDLWREFIKKNDSFLNRDFTAITFDEKYANSICWTSVLNEIVSATMTRRIDDSDEMTITIQNNGLLCIDWCNNHNGSNGKLFIADVDENKMVEKVGVNQWGEPIYGDEIISEDELTEALVKGDTSSEKVRNCLVSFKEHYAE